MVQLTMKIVWIFFWTAISQNSKQYSDYSQWAKEGAKYTGKSLHNQYSEKKNNLLTY